MSLSRMASQGQYLQCGVKIMPPRGTELEYKYLLPPFKGIPISQLVHGVHFFHNMEELRLAFADPKTNFRNRNK